MIPLSEPLFKSNEWSYVKKCLDSGWVSSAGEYVEQFEKVVAGYLGRAHAVACSSGTAALHLALIVSGIKKDEEVVMPALSFSAPANAVKYTGAFPVFIDVEDKYWQLDCDRLSDFLKKECRLINGSLVNLHTRRVVKAILPVHILGHPVDMDPLCSLAKEFGLFVIEDVAESLGAFYKSEKLGKMALLSCLSFNGNKIVTSAGGGMILTDDEVLAKKARYLSTQAKDDPLEFYHKEVGYNYRLSNVHAAIGLAQMECLDEYVEKKRTIASKYSKALTGVEKIVLPVESEWARSTFWLYTILLSKKLPDKKSRELIEYLNSKGIQARPLWHPLHSLPPFSDCYSHGGQTADDLHNRSVSLPSSSGLTDKQQGEVISALIEFFS